MISPLASARTVATDSGRGTEAVAGKDVVPLRLGPPARILQTERAGEELDMRSLARVAAIPVCVGVLVAAVLAVAAGPAAGHLLDRTTISCSTVSGTFHDFGIHDHPIVWHLQIGSAAPQAVATTETPAAFVGSGTATADITVLTGLLNGTTATVQAFATWPGGQSAAQSAELTCGVPAQVGGIRVEAPAAAPSVAPAAVPVPAAARFTG